MRQHTTQFEKTEASVTKQEDLKGQRQNMSEEKT